MLPCIDENPTNLLLFVKLSGALLSGLLLGLALLEESLWDENLVVGWDGTSSVSLDVPHT